MNKRISVIVVALALSGCAWVKPTAQGEAVRAIDAAAAAQCERVGFTVSSVKATILGFARNEEKVAGELETLARNAAPDLGGDAIVPVDEPREGRQRFDVYRCGG